MLHGAASTLAFALALPFLAGCAAMSEPPTQVTPRPPETYSLFGDPLYPALPAAGRRDTLEARLATAEVDHQRDPRDAGALILLARRTAELGRLRAAVSIYTEGLAVHPEDARLYGDRGNLYLALRRFESAIVDLETATRLIEGQPDPADPDDAPDAGPAAPPLRWSVWFDLGLAHYLAGDFASARRGFAKSLQLASQPDLRCASTAWLWQTLMRLGEAEEATRVLEPIRDDLGVVEEPWHLDLVRVYRGTAVADSVLAAGARAGGAVYAEVGYGVAGWRLAAGDSSAALDLMRAVIRAPAWSAPGHVAAEAELLRLGHRP